MTSPQALPAHASPDPPRLQWRYILIDQGVIAIVVTVALNWGIAWLIFRTEESLPLTGPVSIAGDVYATCLLLPVIACFIVTGITRRAVRLGRIPSRSTSSVRPGMLGKLRRSVLARAAVLAAPVDCSWRRRRSPRWPACKFRKCRWAGS